MKLIVALFVLFLSYTSFANVLVERCEIEFEIDSVTKEGFYSIFKTDKNELIGSYKSPIGSEVVDTDNILLIHYDYEMVLKYFVGNFREIMAIVGEFDPQDVYSIDQYGFEMNGNVAKAQVLIFYAENGDTLAHVAIPGLYPVKCLE